MPSRPTAWIALAALCLLGCPADPDDDAADDDAGDDDDDPPALRLMLHGGGAEDDDLYTPFVEAAGFGHIVTLGAVPDPDSYPDLLFWDGYFVDLGAASAETVNTESSADAGDPAAIAALDAADGVYIRGGDQSRYLEHWEGTALHGALVAAWDRGAVIGGSSAGCALLGQRAYDARVGGVAAWEALLDPHDPTVTFTDDFLPALHGVITDTHFTERGRLGRLAVFLARWIDDGASAPIGIGVDPRTALFVWSDGTAEVRGRGSVTVLAATHSEPALVAGQPPHIPDLRMWQLPDGYQVMLPAFSARVDAVQARPAYVESVPGGAPLAGFAALPLDGDDLAQRALGDWQILALDDSPYGWIDGELTLAAGDGTLPGTLWVTALYKDSDTFENHLGGMVWAVAQHPDIVAVGLDIDLGGQASAPAMLTADAASYLLILDGRTATHAGVPDPGGWQTAALEGATLHVLGPGRSWDGTVAP